ncbi:hypothetical protein [Autumnicola psychrophila]|uniref:GOLD domain-containing protein n=1 Tax=Autumnicola psychrophila TaxID=3075592 RepID=A0ABU3DMZ1_9FLAO|nr:hypothetical protein [Zunongwangia sp. F225]MDT0685085.1 hypothetical protein [Zunongwangia sp. F225]
MLKLIHNSKFLRDYRDALRHKILPVLLFVFLITFVSCDEDDSRECIGHRTEFVSEVNAPETGKNDQPVEIEVIFFVNDGCGKFQKFIESGTEDSKTIEVQARYEGCICPEIYSEITAVYTFTPSEAGEYELKFKSGEIEFIKVNLAITE